MFKAIILMCIPGTMDCLEAHDNKNIFDTTKECVERVNEMASEISNLQNIYIPKAFRCELIGELT